MVGDDLRREIPEVDKCDGDRGTVGLILGFLGKSADAQV
jgi:hypothetical protein